MRVLAAEDDPAFRRFLPRMLEGLGHSGEVGADGLELMRMAFLCAPDVILSDIDMPRCDGVLACSILRASQPGLRIILMTGDPSSAERARAAGFLLVLRKPFFLKELEEALDAES